MVETISSCIFLMPLVEFCVICVLTQLWWNTKANPPPTFVYYSNIEEDRTMRKILLVIFICLSLISPASASAESVGVFTEISGTVEIRSLINDEFRQAKIGESVDVSDAIYTHDNARAEITFNDGNLIRLASKTRLKVKEYVISGSDSSEVINLLRGTIRNIVKVVFDPDFQEKKGKYEIHTPIAVCGVRGTDFFVSHEQGVSGAVFVTGKGYSYSSDVPGEVVTMTAGQQMATRSAKEAPQVSPAKAQDIEQFKNATQARAQKGKEQKEIKALPQKAAVKGLEKKQEQKEIKAATKDSKQNKDQNKEQEDKDKDKDKDKDDSKKTGGFFEAVRGFFQSSSAKDKGVASSSSKGASGNSAASGGKGNSSSGSSGGGNSGGGDSGGGDSGGGDSGGGNSGGGNSGGGSSGGDSSGGDSSGGDSSGGDSSGGNDGGGGNGGGGDGGGGNSGGGGKGGSKK